MLRIPVRIIKKGIVPSPAVAVEARATEKDPEMISWASEVIRKG